ncbi:hypothetical protein DFH06DRAFT_1214115 [Mycena polygramma]|nr:hypothetical protein DFH06DRAFT_1214115 [Mycena polygramma]
MDPRPPIHAWSLDPISWEFITEPLDIQRLGLSGIPEQHRKEYGAVLAQPFHPDTLAGAVLAYIWNQVPTDAADTRQLFLASVGVEHLNPTVIQIYDEIKTSLFGPENIPATALAVSVLHRLLLHRIRFETDLLIGRSDTDLFLPPPPNFTFYASLRPRDGFQPIAPQYFKWLPWLRPQGDRDLRYVFANRNWATLGLFREVVDAIIGRHLADAGSAHILAVFRDSDCRVLADEDDDLNGDFFFILQTTDLADIPRPNLLSPAGKRDPKFAPAVKKRSGYRCAFTRSSGPVPEDDLEAAHVFPRPGHAVFAQLLRRYCPGTRITSIDHFCNGLALWVAIHRPWDDHRAAISELRRVLLLAKNNSPISTLQQAGISTDSVDHPENGAEKVALLKLRFTQTMIEWFATRELRELLSLLGRQTNLPRLDRLEQPLPPPPPAPPHGAEDHDMEEEHGADGEDLAEDEWEGNGVGDDDDEEDEDDEVKDDDDDDEVEEDDDDPKAVHLEGCFCDIDADERDPCVLLLYGATQLWTSLGTDAPPFA